MAMREATLHTTATPAMTATAVWLALSYSPPGNAMFDRTR